jgi:hypothetical protein
MGGEQREGPVVQRQTQDQRPVQRLLLQLTQATDGVSVQPRTRAQQQQLDLRRRLHV